MVTPGRMVTFAPIHTLRPMVTGAGTRSARREGSTGWFSVATTRLRSEEHTSELQSRGHLVCRLLLEKKKSTTKELAATMAHSSRVLADPTGATPTERWDVV